MPFLVLFFLVLFAIFLLGLRGGLLPTILLVRTAALTLTPFCLFYCVAVQAILLLWLLSFPCHTMS